MRRERHIHPEEIIRPDLLSEVVLAGERRGGGCQFVVYPVASAAVGGEFLIASRSLALEAGARNPRAFASKVTPDSPAEAVLQNLTYYLF